MPGKTSSTEAPQSTDDKASTLAETVDASKGMESESLPFASIATDDQTVAVAAMAVAAAGEPPSESTTKDTASASKDTDVDLVSANKEGSEAKEETTETKVETAEKTLEKAAGEKKGDEAAALDSPYPYHVNVGKDVISGKGGKVQQYNRHFRNLVAVSFPSYDATSSKIAKRRIGLSIYQQVVDQGGRFLDAQGTELDRSKGVLKVMKALKDAKTWTSEAKRQAKERRESRAKDGTAKGDKQVPNTGDKTKATTVKPSATDPTPAVVPDLPSPPPVPVPETSPDEEPEKEAKVADPKPVDAEKEEEPAKSEDTKSTKKDEKDSKPAKAEKEKKSAKTDKDTKKSEKATKKADKEAKAETADTEKDSVASSRRRRTSKRRVQLPLTGSPPAKAAKKGKGGDDGSVDSNDAVRGLQLLSQAVAHGKSEKV